MFAVQYKEQYERSDKAIFLKAKDYGLEYKIIEAPNQKYSFKEINDWFTYVPVGTIEFCEKFFFTGKYNRINFYPEFLQSFISRKIYYVKDYSNFGLLDLNKKHNTLFFNKKSNCWKADGFPTINKLCNYYYDNYLSELVTFKQEWRYYIAEGSVITTGWYLGEDEDEPAPKLDINWPKDFSGAVDFGRLENGKIELVEAHAPFACGWYGDNHSDYVLWQHLAWLSFKRNLKFWYI